MSLVADYLLQMGDPYAPTISKPSLQQYDNYQIYDLYCVDRNFTQDIFDRFKQGYYDIPYAFTNRLIKDEQQDWLAVQAYAPDKITLDFNQIVTDRYAHPVRVETRGLTISNYQLIYSNVVLHINRINNGMLETTPLGAQVYEQQRNLPSNQVMFISVPYFTTGYQAEYPPETPVNVWLVNLTAVEFPTKPPSYIDLLSGYPVDSRLKPTSKIRIIPDRNGLIKISFFRESIEPIPKLRTIDWIVYEIECRKNKPIYLDIHDAVLGTVQLSGITNLVNNVKTQIIQSQLPADRYQWRDYLYEYLADLFAQWLDRYQTALNQIPSLPPINEVGLNIGWKNVYSVFKQEIFRYQPNILRVLRGNNNYWGNDFTIREDLNFDLDHPMCNVDSDRAYMWHIEPQSDLAGNDNGVGRLTMDSILVKKIGKALEVEKYSFNELDSNKPRVSTIGYYIEKISSLLGHRVDANGEVDLIKEAEIVPQLLNQPKWKQGDTSYSQYCFGKKGIIIPSLPTSYDKSGKLLEQYHICHDIPQLLAALQSDIDKSLGIEQGSQIRVKGLDGKIIPFQNQLAMAIDNQQKITILSDRVEKLYGMNLVQGQELRGLYSGIGIPVSVEKLPVTDVKGKVKTYLPYFSYQHSQSSILGHLTAIKMNLSIALGVLMPKAENRSINPFKRFMAKKK